VTARWRHRFEGGFATVWAAGWIFVCLSIGWVSLLVTAVVATSHHLDSAADLVSLAGATRVQAGSDGCTAAQQVADSNGVELTACRVLADDVVVTVEASVALPFGLDGRLSSTARAGPV
jgi:secretion/DNA translocation related TadE-like protein